MGSGPSAWSLTSTGIGGCGGGGGGGGGGLFTRSVAPTESRTGGSTHNLLITRQYCSFGSTVTYLLQFP